MVDAIHCGAVLMDRQGRIERVNDRLCRLLGRSSDQLVGQPLDTLVGLPAGGDGARAPSACFAEAHEGEFLLKSADGKHITVIMSGMPLADAPPMSEHILVIAVNISGQKKAETQAMEEREVISRLSDTVIEQALELKRYNERLEEKVRERTMELNEANMEAIYMLAVASEAKDADTGAHVRRIQHYTHLLARQLGLPEATAEQFGYSAILHDVGKMLVPDHILKKPGPLDTGEREEMQLHCIAGERILSKKTFFETARLIARSHHENWDGSGYPDGLSREAIPLPARIVHLADIYDALTSERVYKPPWTSREAADHIMKGKGTQFDPNIVDAFRSLHVAGQFTAGVSADRQ